MFPVNQEPQHTSVPANKEFTSAEPSKSCKAAIRRLQAEFPGLTADFNSNNGRVRYLTRHAASGIALVPKQLDLVGSVRKFLEDPLMSQALEINNISLRVEHTHRLQFGHRVDLNQYVTLHDKVVRVRSANLHVVLDKNSSIQMVISSIKSGRKPRALPSKMISISQAQQIALQTLGNLEADSTAELVLNEHEERFDPLFEVTVSVNAPRAVKQYLIHAKTGEVVHSRELLRYARRTFRAPGAAAKCLLKIPVHTKKISEQMSDIAISGLPNRKKLSNHRFIIYVPNNNRWTEVAAKSNGTFVFDPDYVNERSSFSAVCAFVALNSQFELYESCGLTAQTRPIRVFIDDPRVQDNAYFDPYNYEIHIGVGSGSPHGLYRDIALDLGVVWHENKHHSNMLQAPGGDLPGDEGEALGESLADMGQLAMEYYWAAKFGAVTGQKFGVADVLTDRRIIGRFAAPPNGIRIQRNNKRTPQDLVGEVHADGLISGAAKADLLEAMVTHHSGITSDDSQAILNAVYDYTKLEQAAIALVPGHKVMFTDLLRAFLSADQLGATNGLYQQQITNAFSAHGITLT